MSGHPDFAAPIASVYPSPPPGHRSAAQPFPLVVDPHPWKVGSLVTAMDVISLVHKAGSLELVTQVIALQRDIRNNHYWKPRENGTDDGPFCSACQHSERILIRMRKERREATVLATTDRSSVNSGPERPRRPPPLQPSAACGGGQPAGCFNGLTPRYSGFLYFPDFNLSA